eukprot:CAMPEP_0171476028 /NCGR_PEP_ID=MMETSP0946-20130122/3351_1 /TAXON_ID=109269 /ORGANISM="Vaucheria litorea, Strain CCMP2940" /LENGTH=521 /DNA_ID=CAMNT_0012006221 /DNA_START=56 /DNA_END=1617 /DNA_ORIENTATION=-
MGRKGINELKSALLQCDRPTQKFIQPLLGVPAVQRMLFSFLNDDTKSVQEWIWDPLARSRLEQLREIVVAGGKGNGGKDLSITFDKAMKVSMERRTFNEPSNELDDDKDIEIRMLIANATNLKDRAKKIFESRNYRAAYEAYLTAIEPIENIEPIKSAEIFQSSEPKNDAFAKVLSLKGTLYTNAAISAAKAGMPSDCTSAASKSLAFEGKHREKAFYWRARAYESQDMFEASLQDIKNVLKINPNSTEALALKGKLAIDIKNAEEMRKADKDWENKKAKMEEERRKKKYEEWEPRKPPTLFDPDLKIQKMPLQLLNEYMNKHKFTVKETLDEPEQNCGFRCTMRLPCAADISSEVIRSKTKIARQAAAAHLLIAAAKRWNLKNPDNMVDMDLMRIPDSTLDKDSSQADEIPSVTEEFKDWAMAWINVLRDSSEQGFASRSLKKGIIAQIVFPVSLTSKERQFIKSTCDYLETRPGTIGLRPKSYGAKENRRIMVTRDDEDDEDVGLKPFVVEVPEMPAYP